MTVSAANSGALSNWRVKSRTEVMESDDTERNRTVVQPRRLGLVRDLLGQRAVHNLRLAKFRNVRASL